MNPTFTERSHPEFQQDQREAQQALENQLSETARAIEAYRQARTPVPSERAWAKEYLTNRSKRKTAGALQSILRRSTSLSFARENLLRNNKKTRPKQKRQN